MAALERRCVPVRRKGERPERENRPSDGRARDAAEQAPKRVSVMPRGMMMRGGVTVQSVNWPMQGDQTTFRRRALVTGIVGMILIAGTIALAAYLNPALVQPLAPLALAAGLLHGLWVHGAARRVARRAEVERSFADLTVLHHGAAFAIGNRPLRGEFASRRHAARAALERGGWAVIVHAWDRYYVLACEPAKQPRRAPVSFRSRAVADVVPAVRDDVAVSA